MLIGCARNGKRRSSIIANGAVMGCARRQARPATDVLGWTRRVGGAGGIRTLDRALQPYNGLANRRLQPLGHSSMRADMPDARASRKRQIQVTPGLFGGGAAAGVPSGRSRIPRSSSHRFFSRLRIRFGAGDVAPTKGLGAGAYIRRHLRPKRMHFDPGALAVPRELVPWEPPAETDHDGGGAGLVLIILVVTRAQTGCRASPFLCAFVRCGFGESHHSIRRN